jgi:hypothetical protein
VNGPALPYAQAVVVNISGTNHANEPSGSWTGDPGYNTDRTMTVTVCNAGASGNNCSSNSSSAVTLGPPQVSISWGSSAAGEPTIEPVGGVANDSALWINVSVSGMPVGSHFVQCYESGGSWNSISGNADQYADVGSAGTGTARPCFMGFFGRTVWVVVNGVESNHMTR